jgi:hypothetical protein
LLAFAQEWLFVVGTLGALAIVGGWATLILREHRPQILYSAPAMGLIVVVVGMSTLYGQFRLTLAQSAILSVLLGSAMTAAALWHVRQTLRPRALVIPVVCVLVVATAVTGITCDTTFRFDSPGLMYFDGTDHLGYAQMADWLVRHPVLDPPRADPSVPYQSLPELLFRVDTRFGTFELMGVVSLLSGLPGAFAYDITCAIVLSAGILGLCGVFARTPWMVGVLALALLTSHWFDYASSGYLGKLTGFPASLLAVGIFVTARGSIRVAELAIMIIAIAGASIMYSGLVTAFLVATVGLTFTVYDACKVMLKDRRLADLTRDRLIILGLLVGVASLTTGFASRPGNYAFPDYHLDWGYIVPRVLDLENQGVAVSRLDPVQVLFLCAIFGLVVVSGLALTLSHGLSVPIALIGGPSLLLVILFALDARSTAFQLIGIEYPLVLCGLVVLIESAIAGGRVSSGTISRALVSGIGCFLFAVLTVSHLPRFFGSLDRFAGSNTPESARFNLAEIDAISGLIGASTVEVDIEQPQAAIMALVELGRRGVGLQWSAGAWAVAVGDRGNRPWPLPAYGAPAALCLSVPRDNQTGALYLSARYQLMPGACPTNVSGNATAKTPDRRTAAVAATCDTACSGQQLRTRVQA